MGAGEGVFFFQIGCYYICTNARFFNFHKEAPVLVLKVRKFGNSLGVFLPREVIRRLQTSEGESLFLIDGPEDSYRLTAYDPLFENRVARAEHIIARYRNALRKLSQ